MPRHSKPELNALEFTGMSRQENNMKKRQFKQRGRVKHVHRSGLRRSRKGISTLEVVMTTALIFPPLVILAYVGMTACRVVFSLIGGMVGGPLL